MRSILAACLCGSTTSTVLYDLDFTSSSTYPGSGTTVTSLAPTADEGTMSSGVVYDSTGYMTMDGNDQITMTSKTILRVGRRCGDGAQEEGALTSESAAGQTAWGLKTARHTRSSHPRRRSPVARVRVHRAAGRD